MQHTEFRVLDKKGVQRDIVTRTANGFWRSAKVGRTAKYTATILGWHGRAMRLAALVARVEGTS